jgi:Caspase domain
MLFGINYLDSAASRLSGCINDVRDVAHLLRTDRRLAFDEVLAFDDERTPRETTLLGMVRNLNALALRSWAERLAAVWIHFSGHGTSVEDKSGDELDGCDECLCPSDYERAGVLRDDEVAALLARFNPRTRVVFVSDCCHSGTIADLRYRWIAPTEPREENARAACAAPVILLSGARDSETAADAQFEDPTTRAQRARGALTACLLQALAEDAPTGRLAANAFSLLSRVRALLKAGGFDQTPQLSSSFDLRLDPALLPPR